MLKNDIVPYTAIKIIGMKFIKTLVVLRNIKMIFANCVLISIRLYAFVPDSHINFEMVNCKMYSVTENMEESRNQVKFVSLKSAHFIVRNSSVKDMFLTLHAKYFSIYFDRVSFSYHFPRKSELTQGIIWINKINSWFIVRNKITFIDVSVKYTNISELEPTLTFVEINLENVILHLMDSTFCNMSQVIKIADQSSRGLNDGVLLNIAILRCAFRYITSAQYAAIYIKIPKHITPFVNGKISISATKFVEIYATALLIMSEKYKIMTNEQMRFILLNSSLVNCQGQERTGCIRLGKFMQSTIRNVYFVIHNSILFLGQGLVIKSESNQIFSNVTIVIKKLVMETNIVKLASSVQHTRISIFCPIWNFIGFRKEKNVGVTISCEHCKGSLFGPYLDRFSIHYNNMASNNVNVYYESSKYLKAQCLSCPYGGVCISGKLYLRASHWGTYFNQSVSIYQCPLGYCCIDKLCDFMKPCLHERTGTLCGACNHGYSLDLTTNNCINNLQCGKIHRFWFISTIAVFVYVFWLSFHLEVMKLIVQTLQILFKRLNAFYIFKTLVHFKIIRRDIFVGDINELNEAVYFGIFVHFVQVKHLVTVNIDQTYAQRCYSLHSASRYITMLFNADLTNLPLPPCPFVNIETKQKIFYKILFLCSIYIICNLVYIASCGIEYLLNQFKMLSKYTSDISFINKQLAIGVVNIFKYTYYNLAASLVDCLLCVDIGNKSVFKLDGNVSCWSQFYLITLIIFVLHVVMAPLSFTLGKISLKNNASSQSLIISCLFPFPHCLYFFSVRCFSNFGKNANFLSTLSGCSFYRRVAKVSVPFSSGLKHIGHRPTFDEAFESPTMASKENQMHTRSLSIKNSILMSVERHFKFDSAHWDALIMLQLLLLTFTHFIQNLLVKYLLIQLLCVMFLVSQFVVKLFMNAAVCHISIISSIMIVILVNINALKACLISYGLEMSDKTIYLFSIFDFVDDSAFFIFLTSCILIKMLFIPKDT